MAEITWQTAEKICFYSLVYLMPSCHCAGPLRFNAEACNAAGPKFLGSSGVDLLYGGEMRMLFLASILSLALVKGRCFKTKQNKTEQSKLCVKVK